MTGPIENHSFLSRAAFVLGTAGASAVLGAVVAAGFGLSPLFGLPAPVVLAVSTALGSLLVSCRRGTRVRPLELDNLTSAAGN